MTFKEMIKDPGPGLSYIAGFLSASCIVGAVIFLVFKDVNETHIQTLALITTGVIAVGGVIYQVRSTKARQESEKEVLVREKAMALFAFYRQVGVVCVLVRRRFGPNVNLRDRVRNFAEFKRYLPEEAIIWRNQPDFLFGMEWDFIDRAYFVEFLIHNLLRFGGASEQMLSQTDGLSREDTEFMQEHIGSMEETLIELHNLIADHQASLIEVYNLQITDSEL